MYHLAACSRQKVKLKYAMRLAFMDTYLLIIATGGLCLYLAVGRLCAQCSCPLSPSVCLCPDLGCVDPLNVNTPLGCMDPLINKCDHVPFLVYGSIQCERTAHCGWCMDPLNASTPLFYLYPLYLLLFILPAEYWHYIHSCPLLQWLLLSLSMPVQPFQDWITILLDHLDFSHQHACLLCCDTTQQPHFWICPAVRSMLSNIFIFPVCLFSRARHFLLSAILIKPGRTGGPSFLTKPLHDLLTATSLLLLSRVACTDWSSDSDLMSHRSWECIAHPCLPSYMYASPLSFKFLSLTFSHILRPLVDSLLPPPPYMISH